MKIIDCKQGSPEWAAARLGIPTASEFGRLVTPKGKLSEASSSYMCELLAERFLGFPVNDAGSGFMDRGTDLEAQAVAFYELQRDVETVKVGFILRDDGLTGCSPDRLVGDDGILEIKCPSAAVHVSYLLDLPLKFQPQVQGQLWVTGRKWVDLLSYHPELPPALVRVQRDEEYIATLELAMAEFLLRLSEAEARLGWMNGNGADAAVGGTSPTVAEAPQDPKPRPRSGLKPIKRSMVPLVPAVDVAGVDPPQNNLHAASDRAPSSVTRNGGEESGNGIGGTGPEESPPNSLFGMSAGTYYSESRRERIPIATMPTPHIERAASKLERAITESTIREPYIEEQLDDLKAELARRG